MKKAIIVGATSGMGCALCRLLVRDGWTVGIAGRRGDKLEEIRAGSPENISVSAFDATSADAASRLEGLIGTLGGLDLFIFSSGTGDLNPSLDPGIEEATNALNVAAFTKLTGAAYNYFSGQGHGHIVGISSVMGLRGSGVAPSYAASKAYQINYLEGLRQRAVKEKRNITVTDIRPGSVDTDMMKGEGSGSPRLKGPRKSS